MATTSSHTALKAIMNYEYFGVLLYNLPHKKWHQKQDCSLILPLCLMWVYAATLQVRRSIAKWLLLEKSHIQNDSIFYSCSLWYYLKVRRTRSTIHKRLRKHKAQRAIHLYIRNLFGSCSIDCTWGFCKFSFSKETCCWGKVGWSLIPNGDTEQRRKTIGEVLIAALIIFIDSK